ALEFAHPLMTLSVNLSRCFGDAVRKRGAEYFAQGHVRILSSETRTIVAEVRGARRYRVSLARLDDAIVVQCECPYIANYAEPCKHIWAAMLAADQQGLLRGPAREVVLAEDLAE